MLKAWVADTIGGWRVHRYVLAHAGKRPAWKRMVGRRGRGSVSADTTSLGECIPELGPFRIANSLVFEAARQSHSQVAHGVFFWVVVHGLLVRRGERGCGSRVMLRGRAHFIVLIHLLHDFCLPFAFGFSRCTLFGKHCSDPSECFRLRL